MNKTYEITFLLNQEEELKSIQKLLEDLKAKIITQESWGKKNLSYPIKKNRAAKFYHWIFKMETNKMKEFKKKLNFNENIIRYLILVKED